MTFSVFSSIKWRYIQYFNRVIVKMLWYIYICAVLCLVTQSCPSFWNPMGCNLPGSSVHGILQARILEWVGCHALLQGIFLTQLLNPHLLCLLHWQVGSLPLVPSGNTISLAQSCPTLCDPMDCSTPGFPVHHQLPELTQTHDHWVGDAIQPSHPLLSPSPPAFNLSQHQGLF